MNVSRYYEADARILEATDTWQRIVETDGTRHDVGGIAMAPGANAGDRVRLKVSIGRTGRKFVLASLATE